jgi:cytoskeletal protein CcmA (bactofilin family)
MPIWKQDNPPSRETTGITPETAVARESEARYDTASAAARPRTPERAGKESLIAEELTIEGKIEGSGHVRIAGRFKGDVHVKGNLAIEPGATLTGGVRASTVTIGGQLEGNIDGADRVELLETGILNGDLSADSLTVAAGSRMRGKVEFGWERKDARGAAAGAAPDRSVATPRLKVESGATP